MRRTKLSISVLSLFVRYGAAFTSDALQQPLLAQSRVGHGEATHAARLPAVVTPELEDYINHVLKEWHTPGMAVAIIHGNETWAKGFGYATLPSTPVTPHTLFYTGSTSKSFTAAGMSLLVDNSSEYSSIQWKTPLSHLLRDDFVLSNEWATEHITIEDALSHRTGYPRHDMAFSNSTKEKVRRLRHLPMSAEPRVKFQYNNHMYTTAGYLIETLTGKWLGDFFHEYLWRPMGMNETFLGLYDPALKTSGLYVADEYTYKNSTDEFLKTPHADMSTSEGEGGVVSNVLDYVKYLRVMMAEAAPISKAGYRELKTPRSFWDISGPPYIAQPTYSMGWASGVLKDEQIWFHSGTVNNFISEMLIIPSKEMGIVLMANSMTAVRELVLYRILYDLLGVDEEKRYDFEAEAKAKVALEKKDLETCVERLYPDIPSPPLPPAVHLTNHTGHYHDPGYGDLFVYLKCDEESATAPPRTADDEGRCQLQVKAPPGVEVPLYLNLEHRTGNYWLGWAYVAGFERGIPEGCLRTQFRVDDKGVVSHLGVDLRFEGDDAPLVWLERVG